MLLVPVMMINVWTHTILISCKLNFKRLIILKQNICATGSGPRESRSRSWRSPIKIPENCDLGPGEPQSRPRRTPIKDLENSDQGPGELWSRTRRTSFRAPLGLPRPVCSDREQNNHNGHTSVCVASFWAKHAKVLDLLFKEWSSLSLFIFIHQNFGTGYD